MQEESSIVCELGRRELTAQGKKASGYKVDGELLQGEKGWMVYLGRQSRRVDRLGCPRSCVGKEK